MDDQLGKDVHGNILGSVDIVYITVDEENKTVKMLFHDLAKGITVAIQKTAVATGTVIHRCIS